MGACFRLDNLGRANGNTPEMAFQNLVWRIRNNRHCSAVEVYYKSSTPNIYAAYIKFVYHRRYYDSYIHVSRSFGVWYAMLDILNG
jgi:hypothetical protein